MANSVSENSSFKMRLQLCTVCAVLQCKYCVVTGVNNDGANLCRQDACSKASLPTGLLMNLKYYVSPYDLFEDGTGAPVILHENNGRSALEATVGCYCLKERRKQNSNSLAPLCCHPVIQENHRLTCRGHGFHKPVCKCCLTWPSSRTAWLLWSLNWTAIKGDGVTVCRQSLFPCCR